MRQHLTVRGVPEDLSRALEDEKRRQGESLNQTVINLLRRALGLEGGGSYDNGLSQLAGTWSDEDLREFEEATSFLGEVDEELWR